MDINEFEKAVTEVLKNKKAHYDVFSGVLSEDITEFDGSCFEEELELHYGTSFELAFDLVSDVLERLETP